MWLSCFCSNQHFPQKCNAWLKHHRVANLINPICMRKYCSNTLSSDTIGKYKSINPQLAFRPHTPFRMHLLRFHCGNSFDATTSCLKYLLLHVGTLVLIQSSPCYIVWLLPEQHVHCTAVLFNSAGIFESKATTLHRPESRALKIEILSRGFSSLPPRGKQLAGKRKPTHVFDMISSPQSVRMGNLNPLLAQQMALSLVCFYFWWIIHCSMPYCWMCNTCQLGLPRLKLERLILQKAGNVKRLKWHKNSL